MTLRIRSVRQPKAAANSSGLFNSFSRIIQRQISNKKRQCLMHKMMAATTITTTSATATTEAATTVKKLFVALFVICDVAAVVASRLCHADELRINKCQARPMKEENTFPFSSHIHTRTLRKCQIA